MKTIAELNEPSMAVVFKTHYYFDIEIRPQLIYSNSN